MIHQDIIRQEPADDSPPTAPPVNESMAFTLLVAWLSETALDHFLGDILIILLELLFCTFMPIPVWVLLAVIVLTRR